MLSEALNKYNAKFVKREFRSKVIHDFSCVNEFLAQFITDFTDPDAANDLLQAFESVLRHQIAKDIVLAPTLLTIEICPDFTSLYHDPEYADPTNPIMQLPTIDFAALVRAWAQFLAQPSA